jgi:hypothetical protein
MHSPRHKGHEVHAKKTVACALCPPVLPSNRLPGTQPCCPAPLCNCATVQLCKCKTLSAIHAHTYTFLYEQSYCNTYCCAHCIRNLLLLPRELVLLPCCPPVTQSLLQSVLPSCPALLGHRCLSSFTCRGADLLPWPPANIALALHAITYYVSSHRTSPPRENPSLFAPRAHRPVPPCTERPPFPPFTRREKGKCVAQNTHVIPSVLRQGRVAHPAVPPYSQSQSSCVVTCSGPCHATPESPPAPPCRAVAY